MDGSEDVDSQDSTEIGTAEVCVEVVNHASHCTEPEPRIYCRTGLSQSDYSLSSFTSVNPSYRYGNQVGYMSGYYGYPSGDVTSPEVELDRDDVSLLPSQSFASSPLTFEVPVITSEDLSKEYRVSESQMVPVDDEDVTDLECPREFEDEEERLCNSVGKWLDTRSTAMDNESDYSIRVNVDEEDVADCGACEEEEEEEEGVAEASGEMSVGECTGDDLSQLSDGVGVSLATELVSKDTDGNKHQEDVKVTPAVEIIVVSECEKGPNDHFSSGDLISKENVSMLTKADHNSNHF